MKLLTKIWNALFANSVEVIAGPSHMPIQEPLERENYLFKILDGTTADVEMVEKDLHLISVKLTGDTQNVVTINPKRKKRKKKPATSGDTQSITIDATTPKNGDKNQSNGTKTRTNSRKPKQVAPVQSDAGNDHGSENIPDEQQSV